MSELKFTDVDAKSVWFQHHDPLVIRCLIDDDSSVEIMYLDILEKMGISP